MTVVALRQLKRGPLSISETDLLSALVDRGMTCGAIALRMNRHRSTIIHAIARLGLRAPRQRAFDYVRNGSRVVSFGAEEDVFIRVLRMQGYGLSTISRVVEKRYGHKRSANAISIRLAQLAALEEVSCHG
jgi:transposase